MSKDYLLTLPLSPSHSAAIVHGLCLALADLVEFEAGGETSRPAYLKMYAIATAAEVFSQEVAHFFGSRMDADHEMLEAIEARYLEETRRES